MTMSLTTKPLMRGWSHALAAVGALVLTIIYSVLTVPQWSKTISLLIFGATLMLLFTVSAIYHIGAWSQPIKARLRIFDHINIFLLIAGTYTPLCWVLLSGVARVILLVLIWSLALAGIVVATMTARLPRWLSPTLYIAMGWVALGVLPAFKAAAGWGLIGLLFSGGLLYTIGAAVYAFKRPDPWPRTFGFHEIFHLFTIGGGLCFAIAMFQAVVPH